MKQFFSLFSYFIFFFVSCNAFAYGSNVKLLSSKIEMSKGMQGGFIEQETPINLSADGLAKAYAKAAPVYGKRGDNIRINGGHAFVIENRTGQAQQYTLEYKITLNDGRFIRKIDVISMNNNTIERGAALSYTNQYFPSSGSFRFIVETIIRGQHSDYKSESNYVYVN